MAVEALLPYYFGRSLECFTLLGLVVTAYVTIRTASSILNGIWVYFFSDIFGLSFKFKTAGTWAVVTGCTDGIGKAYAENLAKRGLNVVLISRTKAKLLQLAADLEKRFKVQTKIIAADFTKTDIYDSIGRDISGLDIGILVNNVAMCYEYFEFFHLLENRAQLIMDMINCNTISVAMMTSLVLPGMLAKKKGVIINISSGTGKYVSPLFTVYSSTKAFVEFFSRCLQQEYKSSGIIIQVVSPMLVATKMNVMQTTPSTSVPSPDTFARSALNTVGWQSCTAGYWVHAIQGKAMALIPSFVRWKMVLQIRAAALKKMSKSE